MPPGIGLRVGAKLLQSSQLATLLEMNTDTASLLRVVQQVAVWVQGNWIVLSDVYAKDIASSINGVPAELMCQDRDYVLYLFPQNQLRVSSVIRLPSEEIKEILEQVNKRWELLLQVDKAFISRVLFFLKQLDDFMKLKAVPVRFQLAISRKAITDPIAVNWLSAIAPNL